MKPLACYLQGAALLALLLLARQGRSQTALPTTYAEANRLGFHAPSLASEAPGTPAPLTPQPDASGWLLLAGTLPPHATLTADVLGPNGRSLAHRTWHGLTAGPVQLALNVRTVPPGTYTLVLGQDDYQWQLPLVQR